jgi:hypothetical protein
MKLRIQEVVRGQRLRRVSRTAFWLSDDDIDCAIRATRAIAGELERMTLTAKSAKQKSSLLRRARDFKRAHKKLLLSAVENSACREVRK